MSATSSSRNNGRPARRASRSATWPPSAWMGTVTESRHRPAARRRSDPAASESVLSDHAARPRRRRSCTRDDPRIWPAASARAVQSTRSSVPVGRDTIDRTTRTRDCDSRSPAASEAGRRRRDSRARQARASSRDRGDRRIGRPGAPSGGTRQSRDQDREPEQERGDARDGEPDAWEAEAAAALPRSAGPLPGTPPRRSSRPGRASRACCGSSRRTPSTARGTRRPRPARPSAGAARSSRRGGASARAGRRASTPRPGSGTAPGRARSG